MEPNVSVSTPDSPDTSQQAPVPGSVVTPVASGENLAVLPPDNTPPPAPATAAPSQDAVTVNTNLRQVMSEIQVLETFVTNFLPDLSNNINSALDNVIQILENNIK